MTPPRLAAWIVRRLTPRDLREPLLDDLAEAFAARRGGRGPWFAWHWYWGQALAAIAPAVRIRRRRAGARRAQEDRGMTAIDTWTRNLRYAARLLLKSPGFAIAAVATIALGIGANAAIFSLIQRVMLRPLPYGDPDRVAVLWNAADRQETTHLSLQEVLGYRDAQSLADVGAYTETSANLTGGEQAERVRGAAVSGNLFEMLGVSALAGRAFTAADSAPGADRIVVVSHGLWQRRFGGAAELVGQSIQVNGSARTVVGIMPPSFRLPLDYLADQPTELWVPAVIDPANLGAWGNRSYVGIARIGAGHDAASATSELKVIADRWVRAAYDGVQAGPGMIRAAVPLQEFITGDVRRPLLILFGAVAVVLLIACANVVNLLLARADVRRREIAVRLAIGAGRGHVLRQLLTESLLLSAIGGLVGLAVARAAMQVLVTIRPASLPRLDDASLDGGALLFTAGLAIVTGVIFGLAPAMQLSRAPLMAALNDGGRGGSSGRLRVVVRRGLVVTQLACSVVLVVAAGLLVRSLIELHRIDLGFDPGNVLTAQLQLPAASYAQPGDVVRFYRELDDRLQALPGVRAAGAVRVLPLSRSIGDWSITIEGRPTLPNENPNGDFQHVTPGYFRVMGTTLVAGRFLAASDREDAPPVVVINDTMAARYWPGQDAIGKRFLMGGPASTNPFLTIVGVVRTARHNAVVEAPRAEMYLPHAQLPRSVGSPGRAMAVVMKTAADPIALAAAVRATVRSMDRNVPVADLRSMEQVTAAALSGPRFAAFMLGLFAALALTLAAIGTYATISLLVSERSREIGIRIALGAGRRAILGWVVGEGVLLAACGLALGVAGALLATRVLETLLYGVSALDPLTFAAVPVLLGLVAAVAVVNPARRAAALDPVNTLRQG